MMAQPEEMNLNGYHLKDAPWIPATFCFHTNQRKRYFGQQE